MSLVNIDSLQRQVLQILSKIESPAGVELSSYKRNRSISLTVQPLQQVIVRENGYIKQEMNVDFKEVPKLLKTMIKREFPRSRKVRVHKFETPEELDRQRKTL